MIRRNRIPKKANINLRFNLLTVVVYIIGIILIIRLFSLQIVHGAEYREQSNTRLTRESTLEAARGEILDRTGATLVSSDMQFSLEMYKTKIDDNQLNISILNMIQVLEKYGVSYPDSFPISINPYTFTISDEELVEWKDDNNLDENISAEDAFNEFVDKYEITNTTNIEEIRKIIAIRYQISIEGYSSTKSITIADNIPREAVAEFSESSDKFAGINISVKPIREYTSGTLAAHILGYASQISSEEYATRKDTYSQNDIIGKTGIEYVFEEYLKGKNGTKQIDMAVDGTTTAEYISEEAVEGSDVVLTIDANLQKVTEDALAANIQKISSGGFGQRFDTNAGACVVMNVNTGEILAMASYPTYNPQDFVGTISTEKWNEYNNNVDKPLRNKAIQDNYAPGSIFKMVTAITGLETGATTTKERVRDTGTFYKYNESWRCWLRGGHGWVNITTAIEKSCNYFFYTIGTRIDIDDLAKYAKYFGLGVKTGVELPSETAGTVASRETAEKYGRGWYAGDMMSAVIGQSYNSFSPLQMTKYISMIANNGKVVNPTIVESVIRADGTEINKDEVEKAIKEKLGITDTEVEDLNISQESINVAKEGMKSVTSDESGTAYSVFRNFPIEVGGKTGSAETASGSGNGKTNAWFAGFAPYDDPEIAVVVFIENGGHGWYTGETVRTIMEQYFGMNTTQVQEDMTQIPYVETYR